LHRTDKNSENYIEYSHDIAIVAARTIENLIHEVTQKGAAFIQQYILQKGVKKFGARGRKAASDEFDKLHKMNCFSLVVSKMTSSEKKKAMESLMFLIEKRDGRIKGRLVYNGKYTRMRPQQQLHPLKVLC
jgi:hypothetical protein